MRRIKEIVQHLEHLLAIKHMLPRRQLLSTKICLLHIHCTFVVDLLKYKHAGAAIKLTSIKGNKTALHRNERDGCCSIEL